MIQKYLNPLDLMWGDLELSSGSTRIEKKSELEDRMKKWRHEDRSV